MPEYKKKNVKRHKRKIKNAISDDIVMQKSNSNAQSGDDTKKQPSQHKKISVIRGNKIKRRNRRLITLLACGLLALIVLIVSLLTPTGITESVANFSASLKFGNDYPVKLSGGTLINAKPQGNHLFLVSTTNFECYNNNGKNIFSYQHGYQSPIMSVSDARTLLYDQSGKNYSIYNLNREIITGQTENEILCANITRNGSYALATLSDSYSSQVTVFNGKNENVFTWFCSDYTINSVVLAPNGKTLAVSAFSASDGAFVSKVYILKFDSATPIAEYDYKGLVLSLNLSGTTGFNCVLENSVDFISWRKQKCSTFSTEDNILLSTSYKANTLIVSGRFANKNENNITIFDAQGKQKHSFLFSGIVDAIQYKGTNIYILSENNVYHYSVSGELISKSACEFGTRFILPISQKEVATVTDSNIQKINF